VQARKDRRDTKKVPIVKVFTKCANGVCLWTSSRLLLDLEANKGWVGACRGSQEFDPDK
jgi:hypothetical protein